MRDLIERQDAIIQLSHNKNGDDDCDVIVQKDIETIKQLPSAQPEVKPIDYRGCANAMLKMWMDNVVTDGEYSRIMDKLNAYWRK